MSVSNHNCLRLTITMIQFQGFPLWNYFRSSGIMLTAITSALPLSYPSPNALQLWFTHCHTLVPHWWPLLPIAPSEMKLLLIKSLMVMLRGCAWPLALSITHCCLETALLPSSRIHLDLTLHHSSDILMAGKQTNRKNTQTNIFLE